MACLLAGLWVVGLVVFSTKVTAEAESGDEKTDAIVALTGDLNRLRIGISLLREGLAERLFISGVYRGVDVEQLLDVLRENAEGLECCIDVGDVAENTKGNAKETAGWVREGGVKTIRLVTSNYHMPRSLLEFRRVIPELIIIPHPVESEKANLHPWYASRASIKLLAKEYSKYLVVLAGG